MLQLATLPVIPGPPGIPILAAKPKPNSLQLKWSAPELDGGAEILSYEVKMIQPDGSSQILSAGLKLSCTIASLLPGRVYVFSVRAHNKVGVSS